MLEVEPGLPWPVNPHIFCFGIDQCDHWQVAKDSRKGEFRGHERLNAQGLPNLIRSECVCNAVQRHIPFTLGMLTPLEVKEITEKGPYTEPPTNVRHVLEPVVVKSQLWDGLEETIQLIKPVVEQSERTEKDIATALLERQINTTGKTPLHILPSIRDCDTKAFRDVFKFLPVLWMHCLLSCICLIVFADGQTVESLRACKRRWPEEYKYIVMANGYFHAMTHFIFTINEGFWMCCCCKFAEWTHKKKQIYERMKDLQHDNATHALNFHRANTAATLLFILCFVRSPPPELFMADPKFYFTQVQNESGIVLLHYLLYGGNPILRYQRAVRTNQGRICKQMMAYSFHVQRSIAFKTKSVLINITCLLGMCCTHPKIQQVLENTGSLSLFGDFLMAFDRLIEYVNLLQQKRNTAFRGYDSQLHFTKYIKALVHVDAAWKEADGPGHKLDDGIPTFLYNDIFEIYKQLCNTIGPDLVTRTVGNQLWHTGNPVPLDGGDYRERKPWTWIWEVCFGRAVGKGRAWPPVSWRVWVDKWIAESVWPCGAAS